jgi:hypothetical protein
LSSIKRNFEWLKGFARFETISKHDESRRTEVAGACVFYKLAARTPVGFVAEWGAAMSNLSKLARTQIAKAPEVLATVVTDRIGMLLDSTGDIDGESLGAVNAVTADALIKTGETLGLGSLQRLAICAPRRVCVISMHDDEIVGFYLDSSKAIGPFERKLEGMVRW